VLAELNEATIKDYDQLEKTLLSAFELSSEHYRKKFREMKKKPVMTITTLSLHLNCKAVSNGGYLV